jgi:hypothetical protein
LKKRFKTLSLLVDRYLYFFIIKFKQSNIITIESKQALKSRKKFDIYKEKSVGTRTESHAQTSG